MIHITIQKVLDRSVRQDLNPATLTQSEWEALYAKIENEDAEISERLQYEPSLSGFYELDTYDLDADMIGDVLFCWKNPETFI